MNSSNLALRMDADEGADEAPAGMPREGFAGTAASGARRGGYRVFEARAFEVRAFAARAFDARSIAIRDAGLAPFRVR